MKIPAYIATMGLLASAMLLGQDKAADKDGDQPRAPGDMKRLQGTWQMVSGERKGRALPDPEDFSLRIEGDTITLLRNAEVGFKGKLKLDPTKKPKKMDMELTEDSQGQKKGEVSQGIYSLEGDTLKWCNCRPGEDDRPTEFKTNEDTNHMLVVLQRKKK